MFSDLALMLRIEGRTFNLPQFQLKLNVSSFRIESNSHVQLEKINKIASDFPFEGSIHVTFALGEGNLKIPVPSVPG
jgi:hypothetical protein